MNYEENDRVVIAGTIISTFMFREKAGDEEFYNATIIVKRDSGIEDIIPIVISARLIDVVDVHPGDFAEITGRFCSRNFEDEDGRHKELYVLAETFEPTEYGAYENKIFLDGYVCKKPIYRITPLGRDISDIVIAVNESPDKTNYISCICWYRNARYAQKIKTGANLRIEGRIQSRIYQKKDGEGNITNRTAYEVSISKLEDIKYESCIKEH